MNKKINLAFKIIIFLIILFCTSLLVLYKFFNTSNSNNIKKNINSINKKIKEQTNDSNDSNDNKIDDNNVKNEEKYEINKYSASLSLNSDTIGWLTVNNTNINYPVVQTVDNDFYLSHSFDKTANNLGWIYADYRNNLDNIDKNNIIYGHSMIKNKLLFTDLVKVLDENWYKNKENLIINFSIKNNDYKWQIFSVYTINKTSDYLVTEFSDEEFINFINLIKKRSIYDFGIDVTLDDKILTLSTCYKDSDHRIVVHAKKIN